MKRLKRGVIAFFLGEFFALFKKDSSFKKGVVKKSGVDKIQHIIDGLVNFNKELIDDGKKMFDADELEEKLTTGVDRVKHEYTYLIEQVNSWKEAGVNTSEEMIEQFEQRLASWKKTAELVKHHIDDFDIEAKIQELQKTLTALAKKVKKQ